MRTFTIDEQNNITAFVTKEEAAAATGLTFSSQKELAKLTAEWPVGRFVKIWNGFAGVAPFGELKPVKKFTDRKTAVGRIWQAIQRLNGEPAASSVIEEEAHPVPEAATEPEAVSEIAPQPVAEIQTEVAPEEVGVSEVAVAEELATGAPQVPDVAPGVPTATMNDANRFTYVMRKIVGKRLTYAELTGKTEVGPSP
jgi:hypothetical protein